MLVVATKIDLSNFAQHTPSLLGWFSAHPFLALSLSLPHDNKRLHVTYSVVISPNLGACNTNCSSVFLKLFPKGRRSTEEVRIEGSNRAQICYLGVST